MSTKLEILQEVIESLNVEQKENYRNINSILNNRDSKTYVVSELKAAIRRASLISSDLEITQSLIVQLMESSIKEDSSNKEE